jgi:hypothetical protein
VLRRENLVPPDGPSVAKVCTVTLPQPKPACQPRAVSGGLGVSGFAAPRLYVETALTGPTVGPPGSVTPCARTKMREEGQAW